MMCFGGQVATDESSADVRRSGITSGNSGSETEAERNFFSFLNGNKKSVELFSPAPDERKYSYKQSLSEDALNMSIDNVGIKK